VVGENYVDFNINRDEIARYGLTVGDIQDVFMSAVGGMNVTSTVEGLERYPVNIRYSREYRDNLEALKRVLVPTETGALVPLYQLADISIHKGPEGIKSENARKTAWIYVDIRGVDVGTYVENARKAVAAEITLPPKYSLIWSGQFEYMQAASKKLTIVIPLVIVIIFLLLYFQFKNIADSLIVMLGLPFALIGGIWWLYLAGYNTSVAVFIGLIALAGVAAETGIVMLVYLDEAYKRYVRENRLKTLTDLNKSIIEGAVERVRPKLMTVTTDMIGLLPLIIGTETGSEVMKRITSPLIGGMVSSTLLTLIIIPVIYSVVKGWRLSRDTGVKEGVNA
jgi:Cu(I)/Ag(I) efflux system membrane protein CusA/SilA